MASAAAAAAAAHTTSPSPPPPAPIPLTPGPRATRFAAAFSDALSHILRTCSYANFSACFPTPAQHAPQTLRAAWAQTTRWVEDQARREFEVIMSERDVVEGLNELERLMGEARARREMGGERVVEPPHTIPPERLYLAHLAPYLTETETQLHAELEQTQAENEELVLGIQGQKDEVEKLMAGLEGVIADLEGANVVMGKVVEDDWMGREIREMEEEVRAAGRDAKL